MYKLLAPAALIFFLTSCASITQGTSQTLLFKFDPTNATCTLTRDGDGELGVVSSTNNSIKISKDRDDIIAACNAPGYENKTIRLVSSASTAGVAGGAVLDLGITDMITGAMWVYQDEVRVGLNKPGQNAPANPDFAKPL